MSLESVRAFMAENAPDVPIIELSSSSSTMTLSAEWNIAPAQIAKTLLLRVADRKVIMVACGDSRLDNKKVKAVLGGQAKMLPPEEAAQLSGHPVGGMCPFALATPMPIYFDIRLKAYDEVVPGAGSTHSAIRINPLRMAELVQAEWVDLCQEPLSLSAGRLL